MIALVEERRAQIGVAPLWDALGLARATFYRRRGGPRLAPPAPRARRAPRQALTPADREAVLALLHEDRFVDLPPAQVWAQVLDAGQVPVCSIRTMYRVLAANAEVRERRNQLRHPAYHKPELLATAPNQVWSWDITKLLGPVKWTYYYLYVLLDIFSRYVVGWLLARQESAALAKVLIAESCARQHIGRDQLIIHADRGPSMTSQPVALLLATLGVVPSRSRPHVSDDNPFSEAQFKTLKYRPDFPDRFGAYEDAEAFGQRFFPWYNTEHRHGALGLMPPPTTSTTAWPRPSGSSAPRSCALPTRPTPSASRAGCRSRRPCRRRPGSTSPRRRRSPSHRGSAHDGDSQISDADCLIRLDNFRAPDVEDEPMLRPTTFSPEVRRGCVRCDSAKARSCDLLQEEWRRRVVYRGSSMCRQKQELWDRAP